MPTTFICHQVLVNSVLFLFSLDTGFYKLISRIRGRAGGFDYFACLRGNVPEVLYGNDVFVRGFAIEEEKYELGQISASDRHK